MNMNNCKQCGKETERPKFCSSNCAQNKHRQELRKNNPEKARSWKRKAYDTGNIPREDEVMFYGYKEPLRKYEGGFGYRGVLSYSKDEDKVQCHLCGRLFRSLAMHVKTHNLTGTKYKDLTGLSRTTALVGEGTRLKIIQSRVSPNEMQLKALRDQHKKRAELIKKTGKDPNFHKTKLALEKRNERGTCPDQLLELISKLAKSMGRTPSVEEFLKFYKGKYLGSIQNTFGTWTNALAKLNMRPLMVIHTQADLIQEMQNFYKVHGRTPRWSDQTRGLLSAPDTYYKHFRSLNHARLMASVPILIPLGNGRTEEWMPSTLEREKMLLTEKI